MENRALGMIEVRGMLGAVEAADAALKAASVSLLRFRKVGAGLMTVFLTGDVAAVRSAVDAATASLGRMGQECSSHVIPRLSPEVLLMIASGQRRSCASAEAGGSAEAAPSQTADEACDAPEEGPVSEQEPEGAPDADETVSPAEEECEEADDEEADDANGNGAGWSGDTADLELMTVMELRRLARNAGLRTMTKRQIRFAGKAELIRELTAFFETSGGDRR